jgi:hypothetical protein
VSPSLTTVVYPALEEAGALGVSAGDVSAPVLTSVAELLVSDTASSFSAPALTEVSRGMTVLDSSITTLDLSAVEVIGAASEPINYFDVSGNANLTDLRIGRLVEAGNVDIRDNPLLCPEDGGIDWPTWADVSISGVLEIVNNAAGCYETP